MKKRILGVAFGAALLFVSISFSTESVFAADATAVQTNCGTYGEVGPISVCLDACTNCVITIKPVIKR